MSKSDVSRSMPPNLLQQYFPTIRTREAILTEIQNTPRLSATYESWNTKQRNLFLDCCTGVRGIKMLYDAFFKEIMNPEYTPSRLEHFLSLILEQPVKIVRVLPTDSTRIADETSLLIMDIVIELSDGSIANVEVQKIGYRFPGQRSACYSADLLLRQYKRIRQEWGTQKLFDYEAIKTVYTIVLFEKSPKAFLSFSDDFLHHFRQKSDTGVELNLLQEYNFISLDLFRKSIYNKPIKSELDAWLTFLSTDEPERILELLQKFPMFRSMYEQIYDICQNTERVMGMFSRELKELDDNTVKYMIDELQEELDEKAANLEDVQTKYFQAKEQLHSTQEARTHDFITLCQEFGLAKEATIQKYAANFQISPEDAVPIVSQYWK